MVATGVAVASWPDSNAVSAEPAASSSPAAPFAPTDREQRENRSSTRPSLSPSASSASVSASKAAASKAAASKAAASKAAASKASVKASAKASKASASKASASKAAASKAAASKAAASKIAAKEAERAKSPAVGTRYTTADVNVRAAASADGDVITVLDTGAKVQITDVKDGDWRMIRYQGTARWVTAQYLAKDKPKVEKSDDSGSSDNKGSGSSDSKSSGGITQQPCSSGSSVEDGLTPDAILVHRTICANFPQVKSYGGVRSDSIPGHPDGRALDSMIGDSGVGWQIARYARSHAKELGISEVIYSQQIWTVQRSGEGWRSMPDRGSPSANHYDHVHVTVYGNAANG